jgi:hypothetical protein
MSESALDSSPTAIRDALLSGTATFKEIAEALGVTERTVYRLNLPFVRVAGKRRAVLAQAREKLMRHVHGGEPPPRRRGRPRRASPEAAKEIANSAT